MKKSCLLLFVALLATSCAVGTYYPYARNNFGAQTTVVLDKANFRVVRDVEVVVDVNNTNLSRADVANSAYGALLQRAQLTGSQVLINVVIEEVQRASGFLRWLVGRPKIVQHVAARATIIEFLDETGNPIISPQYRHANLKNATNTNQSDNEIEDDDLYRAEGSLLNMQTKLRNLGWQKSILGLSYSAAVQQVKEMDGAASNIMKINQVVELVLDNKLSKDTLEKIMKVEINKGKKEYQVYLAIAENDK